MDLIELNITKQERIIAKHASKMILHDARAYNQTKDLIEGMYKEERELSGPHDEVLITQCIGNELMFILKELLAKHYDYEDTTNQELNAFFYDAFCEARENFDFCFAVGKLTEEAYLEAREEASITEEA